MNATYFCCKENRRDLVLASSALNGIDFLEVQDDPTAPPPRWQRQLAVHFLKPLAPGSLTSANVRIEGGERIRPIKVREVSIDADILTVRVEQPGDFSIYTLRLTSDPEHDDPPDGFDPILSGIDFSFKVDCPSDFDCRPAHVCPPVAEAAPEIDYLAKDYASFRQLMLDRMSVLMPQWTERNAADLGITLVELLAYVGDQLSYEQDGIATEAYLGTARRRTSIRRHVRLVDYFMHDGCNARVWAQIAIEAGTHFVLPKGTQLLTAAGIPNARIAPNSADLDKALRASPEVFETMHDARLFAAHAEMKFYAWGDEQCCLPKGATRATLLDDEDNPLQLQAGDVLIFEERLGPHTGQPEDADPMHRQAIRLTSALSGTDPLTNTPIVEIEWAPEDALAFPLCISAISDSQKAETNVSVALGNIVLADHGLTIPAEEIGPVPDSKIDRVPADNCDRCQPQDAVPVPPRFRPRLQQAPLTMAVPLNSDAPAALVCAENLTGALPAISLDGESWQPKRDLLASDAFAKEFVVEVDDDGVATLRFGDDEHGLRPETGETFTATYRVGNGRAGNIGRDSLAHIVTAELAVIGVRNPLAARGGTDAETIEEVRQNAPSAFRVQERAVTPADYAEVAKRHAGIQDAAATFRWTGSWRTVFLTIDRIGGLEVDADFKTEMRAHMERYRMAGHDLEINGPLYVSLEIEMTICVKPDYFRGDVEAALLQIFSNRVLPDGTRGLFHPDNFSFGQTFYLSPLYAAAMKVEGVGAVKITTFQRQAIPDTNHVALTAGKLELGPFEIARLDNDRNFPEHGVIRLTMENGK